MQSLLNHDKALTIASTSCGAEVRVASIDDFRHSSSSTSHCGGLASNGDLHGVGGLVNLDVGAKVLLQGLDCLTALPNHAPHHALGALHLVRHAGAILRTLQTTVVSSQQRNSAHAAQCGRGSECWTTN